MVRVGVWGAFDVDDVGLMLLPRIARRELQARLPGTTVRTWTSGASSVTSRPWDTAAGPPMPLGAWGSSRTDELAVAIDLLVIGGELSPEHPYLVTGVGPVHEGDVPTAWHAVHLREEPDGPFSDLLREALDRRAYVTAVDERTADLLRTLVDREVVVVPGHALLADRLLRPDEPEDRTARLRASGVLPEGDLLVVQGGEALVPDAGIVAAQVGSVCRERGLVPVLVATPGDGRFVDALATLLPTARRLPATTSVEDLCATVAWSAGSVVGSPDLALVATAYGRPAVLVQRGTGASGSGVPSAVIADAFGRGDPIAARAQLADLRTRLDAHFDRIAALAARVEPVGVQERKVRTLVARIAEHEAAAARRERELEEMLTKLTRQITESDVRFMGLWQKIRECDKHYTWQFNRAEAAEELVARLEEEVRWLRTHARGESRFRRAYLAVRRRVGRVLRRLGLRPRPPAPPQEPPTDIDA